LFKKLDILIIRSFVGPFIVTFFVTLFVLVMQFFWVYMDELIGKGLGIWMILQMLVLMSATLVPLALPLGILLASIMTFGNMGENFELVAIKSAGISLNRFMRPLLAFIAGISILAFLFNNHVIPVANLKALSLLYDLRNSKPALNIRAGIFNNDIQGFSIRIGEKDKDGRTIRDIIIYDKTNGFNQTKLILAKEGEMIPAPNKQYLIFRLRDGWRYEEGGHQDGKGGQSQTRMHFGQWDKVFDLSSFRINRTDEELFKGAYQMMNVRQLHVTIDSMENTKSRMAQMVHNYLTPYFLLIASGPEADDVRARMKTAATWQGSGYDSSFMERVRPEKRTRVTQLALSNSRNIKELVRIAANDRKLHTENLYKYKIEWHRKFTLSFACILLFLVGAPLGAIIRKGGLGMPMVIAIAFFLVWYIISITGEKLSKSGALPAWIGMWISAVMLLPIALVMVRQARNDSQIFSREWYLRIWRKIRGVIPFPKK
jgi:lipopolysaccharide export system permease protein